MAYDFSGKRYLTSGIQQMVDIPLQLFLWGLVDGLVLRKKPKPDYLQVFDLSLVTVEGKTHQQIVHRQEQPDYKQSYRIATQFPISQKIYIIDDGEVVTMLLAEEY